MEIKHVLEILETRKKAAEATGNTTELSFVKELIKMINDYKVIKEQVDKR